MLSEMPRVLPETERFEPFRGLLRRRLRCAAALGTMFRFSFDALLDCAVACLPPALEGFFIASTRLGMTHRSWSREHRPWAPALQCGC